MTFVVALSMPKGARPMNELDIRRLKYGQLIDVLDTHTGHVSKVVVQQDAKDGSVVVKWSKGGHVETLGAADLEQQFIPVTTQLADEMEDPNNALAVALRASNEIAKLMGRVRVLEEARHADANRMQAMLADITNLQEQVRGLQLKRAS